MNNHCSSVIITNTGAPQGCVLSPTLFTLYTNDCATTDINSKLFKYADDTALVSLCTNDDVQYRQEVRNFTEWCNINCLVLNVNKTKEMIIDFSKNSSHAPLYIADERVEVVDNYKYLGVTIDDNFNFNCHVTNMYKKCNKRVYFIRKLSKLHVDMKILSLFYASILQSVISFAITCWYGNSSLTAKNKVEKIMKVCENLGVHNVTKMDALYEKAVTQRCKVIMNDVKHPLYPKYQTMPSGKRLRSIKCRTSRYSTSFVPTSVRMINLKS